MKIRDGIHAEAAYVTFGNDAGSSLNVLSNKTAYSSGSIALLEIDDKLAPRSIHLKIQKVVIPSTAFALIAKRH